jgi:hypothetical protein
MSGIVSGNLSPNWAASPAAAPFQIIQVFHCAAGLSGRRSWSGVDAQGDLAMTIYDNNRAAGFMII